MTTHRAALKMHEQGLKYKIGMNLQNRSVYRERGSIGSCCRVCGAFLDAKFSDSFNKDSIHGRGGQREHELRDVLPGRLTLLYRGVGGTGYGVAKGGLFTQ